MPNPLAYGSFLLSQIRPKRGQHAINLSPEKKFELRVCLSEGDKLSMQAHDIDLLSREGQFKVRFFGDEENRKSGCPKPCAPSVKGEFPALDPSRRGRLQLYFCGESEHIRG